MATLSLTLNLARPLFAQVAWPGVTLLTPFGQWDILLSGRIRRERAFRIGIGFVVWGHAFGLFFEVDPELEPQGTAEDFFKVTCTCGAAIDFAPGFNYAALNEALSGAGWLRNASTHKWMCPQCIQPGEEET